MNLLRLLQLILVLLVAGLDTMAQSDASQGLKGEYYSGSNFNRKVFTRIDKHIHFDWHRDSPGPGLDKQFYSIRWTGKLLAPTSGTYLFAVEVDDGVRIWVGGKKIIDAWDLHDNVTFRGYVALQAGQSYDLRIDYFNDILEGEFKLYWVKPDELRRGLGSSPTSPGLHIDPTYLTYKPKPTALPVTSKVVASTPKTQTSKPISVNPKPVSIKPTTVPANKASVRIVKTTNRTPVPKPIIPSSPTAVTAKEERPISTPPVFDQLKSGETVVLQHVLFKQSEYVLLPTSYDELDKLVRTLKQQPGLRVEIGGHTDNIGDPKLNQTLSEYRAKVVANYLIRHGIADERLTTKGYGGSRPLADNTTEATRITNRRVELTVQ